MLLVLKFISFIYAVVTYSQNRIGIAIANMMNVLAPDEVVI